ncbi:xanthine dehydrogenase accessory protein XdhC [Nakamurella sp. GG22]
MDWLSAVEQLRRDALPGVLVTVMTVRGHAPRDAGAKMVVGADHSWGSVGGGNLEEAALRRARELIASAATVPETQEFRLNEHARNRHGRQCCGGEVTLLLEPLPARPVVAVFGIGHVGYELARILSRLEIALHLVDSRADQVDEFRLAGVTEGVADVTVHHALLGEQVLERLPRGAHVLIMTHDHAEDFALCDAAVRLPHLGSIGLIGSSSKWTGFRRRLRAEGHADAVIDRITSPIGMPGIAGKEPAVIAVSVACSLVLSMQQQASARADRSATTDSEPNAAVAAG